MVEISKDGLVLRRFESFHEAVADIPAIAIRLKQGQQFNAFDSSANDGCCDEDCIMVIGLGPIGDMAMLAEVEGRTIAKMIADALTFTALSDTPTVQS